MSSWDTRITPAAVRWHRLTTLTYSPGVFVDEFLAAVQQELSADDPIRPAVAALPTPVPFMNLDERFSAEAAAGWSFEAQLSNIKRLAENDPAFASAYEEGAKLQRDGRAPEDLDAAEAWARQCAGLIRDADGRLIATHLSLALLALQRADDKGAVQSLAKVFVGIRAPSGGFLLLSDLAQLIHRMGFTDRR